VKTNIILLNTFASIYFFTSNPTTKLHPTWTLQERCRFLAVQFRYQFIVPTFPINSFHITTEFTLVAFIQPFTVNSSIATGPLSSFLPSMDDFKSYQHAC